MKNSNLLCILIILCCFSCKNTKQGDSNHTHDVVISNYFDSYVLADENFGTETVVVVDGDTRKMTTNALPNHNTGTFPNAGNPNTIKAQEKTYTFPTHPVFKGDAVWVREFGVALNGVKFEPETAERVICESGETYRVEAKQGHFDLGLDDNNAHVQPTGEYHYHGTPKGVVSGFDSGQDLVHIGFANDGFPVYYSKSEVYTPSYRLKTNEREGDDCNYTNPHQSIDVDLQGTTPDGTYKADWEYVEGLGDLDACNGIEVNGDYIYLITDSYPYVGRCLNGNVPMKAGGGGPPPGNGPPRGGGPPPHYRGGPENRN